ncbi:hypothetical protein ACEXOS_015100 [Herbiconiux sp. P16]|uniref:hypothetical protein n=1 Tax=Herbiconiux wuyangfengii TaxID=3342794 RepID=UPI0035B6C332
MPKARRDRSESKCVRPQHPVLAWHDYVDETDEKVVELADWISSLRPFAQLEVVARLDELEERAAAGLIQIPQDGAPADLDAIQADPEVYELRWTVLNKKVRQYHGEPDGMPHALVRLHRHIKVQSGRNDPTAGARQQVEIMKAVDRYKHGESSGWA